MKRNKIEEALVEVRDEYIAEAAGVKKKPRLAPWMGAVAAVLIVAILCGILLRSVTEPVTAHAYGLIAAPEYPEMAPYPDGYTGFAEWHASQRQQYDQPAGYADSLNKYFSDCMQIILSDSDGQNVVCSPVNIYMALALLAETTDGNSRQQLLDLLGAESIDALRTQANHVWNAHYCADNATTLTLGNSLWLNEGLNYAPSTVKTLTDSYYASVYQGKLGSSKMNKSLQDWLNAQTGGFLEEYASKETLSPETFFALASTIYYRVKWADQFSEKANTEGVFHAKHGDVTHTFMNQTLSYGPYYYGDGFSAVQLALEDSGRMWLILPDEGCSTEDVLSSGTLDTLLNGTARSSSLRVNLSLPKFNISSGLELSGSLQKMGISDVFNPAISNYSALLPNSSEVYLGRISHAARVSIDEEGIEAAAYTVLENCGAAISPEDEIDFVLDRPFAFVIESRDGLPLFAGIVNQP